jgi:hypothetical protein
VLGSYARDGKFFARTLTKSPHGNTLCGHPGSFLPRNREVIKEVQRNKSTEKKKGSPGEATLLLPYLRRRLPELTQGHSGLREVVAERSPDHVVDGLWRNASGTRPSRLGYVGVLQAPLYAALGAVVELMPEAQGGFHYVADVSRAGPATTWEVLARGCNFRTAAGIVG